MRRSIAPRRAAPPQRPVRDPRTIGELLTGWHTNAQGVHEPDTLEGCEDYVRHLDAMNRARLDADALCSRLATRVAAWVDAYVHDCTRVTNRLTPPG